MNVYGCNNGISGIHGKELPKQLSFHFEFRRSHTQMFDIFAKLVSEQDEISGLETIGWENHSWKYLSFVGDERNHQSSTHEGPRLFGFCVVSREDSAKSSPNEVWEQRLGWFKSSQNYRNFDRIDGEPTEFEWNIFPGFTTLQLCDKVKLSIHFAAVQETIETLFRIIISANQLSLYGAVANICEEYESLHDRSGQPDVVMGQSIVLSAIKTEVSLESDDIQHIKFFFSNNMKNELRSYHNKTN